MRLDYLIGYPVPDSTSPASTPKKRRILRWALIAGGVAIALNVIWNIFGRRVEGDMQRSFDEIRVQAVIDLTERAVAFRDATGRCPLGHLTDGEPLTVLLTNEYPTEWPPQAPRLISPEILAEDLTEVEGKNVTLPMDPQKVSYDFWPAIQYETNGNYFTVGVSLSHPPICWHANCL